MVSSRMPVKVGLGRISWLVMLEVRLAQSFAHHQAKFGIEASSPLPLGLDMLRVHPPGLHRFCRFEFDQRDAFAIVRNKGLMRQMARHGRGKLAHARGHRPVFILHAGPQARPKYHNHHWMTLPRVGTKCQSAAASIPSMSSSDNPKWWPISCTSTCVMMVPSVSSCSAQ